MGGKVKKRMKRSVTIDFVTNSSRPESKVVHVKMAKCGVKLYSNIRYKEPPCVRSIIG